MPVEQAERRNLIMVNPIEGNIYATSRNIVAAYQMVKAGEKARSHRHTAAALRLVVEAKPGTYTVVDGARIDMVPGDVVLTPSWCWHGHANESDATSYWIDFLDVPFVQHSEAMFFEPNPGGLRDRHQQRPSAATAFPSRDAFGPGNRRQDGGDRQGRAAHHRPASHAAARRHAPRGREDHGQSSLLRHQRQGAGRRSRAERTKRLAVGDVMTVPCWHAHALEADEDAVVLRVTDEPLLAKVGLVKSGVEGLLGATRYLPHASVNASPCRRRR